MTPVTVIGIGPGNPSYLTERARTLIATADIVAGFRTVLEVVQPWVQGRALTLDYSTQEATLRALAAEAANGRRCVICAWGDPSFSGQELVNRVRSACGSVDIVPGISSAQVACARAGLAWEDTLLFTFHARRALETDDSPLRELIETLRSNRRSAIVLPRPWDLMPPALAKRLLDCGIEAERPVIIYERLTLDGEREHRSSLGELATSDLRLSDLSVLVLPLKQHRTEQEHAEQEGSEP